ncbi:MAG: hypothetical protein NTV39_01595 [Candidatus Saccharibacteria bacterium]|nr:hypothetical protein [Candidatus Saccharibacteria bacterium]
MDKTSEESIQKPELPVVDPEKIQRLLARGAMIQEEFQKLQPSLRKLDLDDTGLIFRD